MTCGRDAGKQVALRRLDMRDAVQQLLLAPARGSLYQRRHLENQSEKALHHQGPVLSPLGHLANSRTRCKAVENSITKMIPHQNSRLYHATRWEKSPSGFYPCYNISASLYIEQMY